MTDRAFAFTDLSAFPTSPGTVPDDPVFTDEQIREAAQFVWRSLNHDKESSAWYDLDWDDDDEVQDYVNAFWAQILSVLGVCDAYPALNIASPQSPPPDRVFFVWNTGRTAGINSDGLYHPGDNAESYGPWPHAQDGGES